MANRQYTDAERFVYSALICQSMCDGMTMRKACALHGISPHTFWGWTEDFPEIRKQYTQAQESLYRHWEQEIIEIADTQHEAVIVKDTPQGRSVETRDAIDHRRLRIQTRQWLLSKLKPKKFGDKVQVGGADDLPPMRSVSANGTLTPEEAYRMVLNGTREDE